MGLKWALGSLALFLIGVGLVSIAGAKSRVATNEPYVTCLGGTFYARAIPDEEKGTKGTTTIYRVRRDQDEVIERHAWYAPDGLHLGWSPIAGKVAAMAVGGTPTKDPSERVEFRFYLGAEHLTTYTTADLIKLGLWSNGLQHESRRTHGLRVVGCEQIPRTNEYVFRIVLDTNQGEKTIDFDILTGKPYDPARAATRPAHD